LIASESVFGYSLPIWNYVPSLTNRFWDTPAKPNPHRLAAAQSSPAYVEHKNVRLARRHPEIFFEKRVTKESQTVCIASASKSPKPPTASFTISESPKIPPNSACAKNELYRTLGREKTNRLPQRPPKPISS